MANNILAPKALIHFPVVLGFYSSPEGFPVTQLFASL
jgi:hypothetical protein